MNYFLKITSLPENPCFDAITKTAPSELFEKSKTDLPFETRILPHNLEAEILSTLIDNQCERTPPPWEQNNIMFDTSLSCFTKDRTSKTVFRKEYQQLCEHTVHTSKPTQMVQSVNRKWQQLHFTLETLKISELFGYETAPLFLVYTPSFNKFSTLTETNKKFIIYTGSFSAFESMRGKTAQSKNIKRFYNLLKK